MHLKSYLSANKPKSFTDLREATDSILPELCARLTLICGSSCARKMTTTCIQDDGPVKYLGADFADALFHDRGSGKGVERSIYP
jgi:hypothetical protein